MTDWQQPGPPQQPTPPPPGYAPTPPYGSPAAQPKKKRTGLIVAIVVIVLLLCCCGSAAIGLIAYRGTGDWSTSFTSDSSTSSDDNAKAEKEEDPTAEARAAEWAKVASAFVRSPDAEYTRPDDRQLGLAKAVVGELLPDFALDELLVHPGYVDDDGSYVFDGYTVKVHLLQDPRVIMAYGFDVGTKEADAAQLHAEDLEVDEGDDKMQVGDGTWVLYPARTKAPLLRGIKDRSYVDLLLLAKEQWPEGLPTEILPQEDGSVLLKIEMWESYIFSDTYDRIEATYIRASGWELRDFRSVIEPKDEPGTDQGVVI